MPRKLTIYPYKMEILRILSNTTQWKHNRTKILNAELKNKKKKSNQLKCKPFTIITYPFGIIYLTQSRSNKLQKIKNTFMTRCWKYYSRSCIERVLMPNKERSRGYCITIHCFDPILIWQPKYQ